MCIVLNKMYSLAKETSYFDDSIIHTSEYLKTPLRCGKAVQSGFDISEIVLVNSGVILIQIKYIYLQQLIQFQNITAGIIQQYYFTKCIINHITLYVYYRCTVRLKDV